jgi:hypothetical protein
LESPDHQDHLDHKEAMELKEVLVHQAFLVRLGLRDLLALQGKMDSQDLTGHLAQPARQVNQGQLARPELQVLLVSVSQALLARQGNQDRQERRDL